MKPKFFLKGAVVAMAALGAFAFNGNTQAENQFTYRDGLVCTDIEAECSEKPNGPNCTIIVDGASTDVYDFNCGILVKHDNLDPVSWNPVNP